MTLLRQLLLSVTVVVVIILAGTLVFSTTGARNYLGMQLQTDSDNAASSLALSLGQAENRDQVLSELLITALFDSGRFSLIELRDVQGKIVVSRQLDEASAQVVPRWFDQVLPLRSPLAVRDVTEGWKQVGKLTVAGDTSQARATLWDSSIRVLLWVLLAAIAWAAFVWLALRWIRRALHAEIARQVEAVAEGQKPPVVPVPSAIVDLLPGDQVLAHARERVQASKQEATAKIESLTLELNHDEVTGLPNRRYFINELHRALQQDKPVQTSPSRRPSNNEVAPDVLEMGWGSGLGGGYLLLCRQRDLASIAAALPRAEVDAWLRTAGKNLEQTLEGFTSIATQVGRLNGSDFAVLLSSADGPQAMRVAEEVRRTLLRTGIATRLRQQARWAFAATDFLASDSITDVFTRLDNALMKAESAGHGEVESLLRTAPGAELGHQAFAETQWRHLLTEALAADTVSLSVQPVRYGQNGTTLDYYEASLSLYDPADPQHEPLSGFSFFPVAVRMGLSGHFDLRALRLARQWLARNSGVLIVRMALPSLLTADFLEQLQHEMTEAVADGTLPADRLIVELDAWGLAAYPADVQKLVYQLQEVGVQTGIRAVAQHLDVLASLHEHSQAYIKLSGGFMAHLDTSTGAVELLRAALVTARALGVQVLIDEKPATTVQGLLQEYAAAVRM